MKREPPRRTAKKDRPHFDATLKDVITVGNIRGEAVVVVIEVDGRVLMIKRAKGSGGDGYWTPPSGRIEAGETQEETVVREVLEEVGMKVRPLRWVWECPTSDGTYWLHWWLAEFVAFVHGRLVIAPAEVEEARWMSVARFLTLEKTFEDDRYFFKHIFPRVRRGDDRD